MRSISDQALYRQRFRPRADNISAHGTMTNRLDKLEGAGLVAHTKDPKDRRGKAEVG